jgi:adenylate cyclase
MAEQRALRRLAAILAADVVGYSRLTQADEAGTLAALKARRSEILQPTVSRHDGRIVKLMGDGVLVEFASAVNAVDCAVQLQGAMSAANAGVPEDRQIVLRIGINLGDVVVEGGDLYGDGVNIAARLEALADPGSVYVSQTVFGHVRGKVACGFEDLGERSLKNMPEPVRVYRLSGTVPFAKQAPVASDQSLKPSIAVLPFTNMSGDPQQEYFADGMTEDIITELSRFRSLLVIARNSSFSYKGRSPKIQDVGRELGVRYVVEGSVRRTGNRLRVTAQLVEAASGVHIWADRFDREMADIFAVQDEVVRTVVATVAGRLDEAGKARARARGLSEAGLQAYDLYLRAVAAEDANTKDAYHKALGLLQQAISLDPELAQAHHQISLAKFVQWMAYWAEDREATFSEALDAAKRALALDSTNSGFRANFGLLLMCRDEHEEARSQFEKAIELNPNDAKAMALYGFFLASVHELDEAILAFDRASRLNPLAPDWINWLRGIAFFTAHRYPDAIRCLRSIKSPINEVRGWLAASYAQAGKLEQARRALEEFLRAGEVEMANCPPRKLAAWRAYWHGAIPYTEPADETHLLDGLRKAGLPD